MSALQQVLRASTGALRVSSARRIAPTCAARLRRPMSSTADAAKQDDAPAAAADAPAADSAEAKLKAKDEELADLTSRLRYAQADLVNQQRIAAREKEQQAHFAISRFALDLLETADVLSLALRSLAPPAGSTAPPASADSGGASDSHDGSAPHQGGLDANLRAGVEMTQKQLLATFAKYGVVPFDPTGEKFDPNRHEALFEAPAPPGTAPGTVIDCQKLGYTIKDRTLRAAQVGVAK